eukprot:TRINITY_DN4668_c0_g1_i2.p1 TRINITY_DN4668_c0_g1~~TRINITY_DN4668_c0_g1_i2.p1  ORF type:complete len:584 (+),score=103.52 TRINITY_DN4668_c0_g1_i2:82-1833(+)
MIKSQAGNKKGDGIEQETFKPGLDDSVIRAMSVAEDLDDISLLRLYVGSDMHIRRTLAAKRMVDFVSSFAYEDLVQLTVPFLTDLSRDPIADVRQALAESIPDVAELFLKFHNQSADDFGWEIPQFLLPILFSLLCDSMLPIRGAAMNSIIKVARMLGPVFVERSLIPPLNRLIQSSTDDVIAISVETLSHLAELISPDSVQSQVLGIVIASTKLGSFRTRKAVVDSIERFSSSVGYSVSVSVLLPLFLKLSKDEMWGIRKASLDIMVNFAKNLPIAQVAIQLMPFMSSSLSDVSKWVKFAATENLGPFMQLLGPELMDEQYLVQFLELSKPVIYGEGNPDAPYYCATSFAGVLSVVGKSRWDQLKSPFFQLCESPQIRVRKCLASSLAQMATILGPDESQSNLFPIFMKFLNDVDEVKFATISILYDFFISVPHELHASFYGLISRIASETGVNWRIRNTLMDHIARMCTECTESTITRWVIPLMASLVVDPVWEVRSKASVVMSDIFLRVSQHEEAKQFFIKKVCLMASSRSYIERQTCAYTCSQLTLISHGTDQQIWIDVLAKLDQDKVSLTPFQWRTPN